ncbi:hypothetical protein JCM6882_007776 [Rhodosporidiobolus microsporus]
MATSTSKRPPSSFDKLPLELVQRVVELVRQQDKAFEAQTDIERAPFRAQAGQDEDEATATKVLDGKWSCWLGRGTVALSLVDKQFRSLTFPSLCEVVTLKQLATPFFRYRLSRRPDVVAAIRSVDLRGVCLDRYTHVGPLLPLLSAPRLILDTASRSLLNFDHPEFSGDADEVEEAVTSFRDFVQTANAVETHDLGNLSATMMLRRFDLANLRELKITSSPSPPGGPPAASFNFGVNTPGLRDAFERMINLETLEIAAKDVFAPGWNAPSSWAHGLSLPSVTTLTLAAGDAAGALLAFVPSFTPNLRHLTFTHSDSYDLKTPAMPSLRHFNLFIAPCIGSVDVSFHPSSSLTTLTVGATDMEFISCQLLLPVPDKLPTSLRMIFFELVSAHVPDDVEVYRAACAARGVTFRLVWTPDLYPLGNVLTEGGYAGTSVAVFDHIATTSAREALEWAAQRLEHAERTGDTRTLHEIIQATTRLRERQAIELQ